MWRDELDALKGRPPFRTDDKVLFVSFVANAEICCHLALGWPVPKNILDLSPWYFAASPMAKTLRKDAA